MRFQNWKTTCVAASVLTLTLVAGCGKGETPKEGATPSKGSTPVASATNADLPGAAAVRVGVKEVGKREVTIDQSYTATILAAKEVQVQSRVQGNLLNFTFKEGSRVFAGQTLFEIDRRALLAAVASADAQVQDAKANLDLARNKVNLKKAQADQASAEANLVNEQREVDRYKPLMERSIIPRQLYDQTVSARDVAKAQLDAAKANTQNTAIRDTASIATAEAQLSAAYAGLDAAKINLSYTTIDAPITGTIGQLNVYPGNLVSPGNQVLATISSTDPIYVEFAISESAYLALSRQREASGKTQSDRVFQLLLADGKPYKYLGKFSMISRAVDTSTGTLGVRLSYENPEGLLRPGEFANVKLNASEDPNALLIPQRAVQELQSSNFVFVVNAENQVEQRDIEVGERFGNDYIVTKGLKMGERVITDGVARVKPGMTVSTEEAE